MVAGLLGLLYSGACARREDLTVLPRERADVRLPDARPSAMHRGASGDSPQMTIVVELDVFSGRPNPTWALDGEQARELLEVLETLQPASSAATPFDGLGYRGFKITGLAEGTWVAANHGSISVSSGGRTLHKSDPRRTVELWLLQSARGRVDSALLQSVAAVIVP